jgi:DNA/RNA endonuclease YhcR with UshA esterase domain
MNGSKLPVWTMEGIVVEIRELKTAKGGTERVWRRIVKLAAMGGTFELSTESEELANQFTGGEYVGATGIFGQFNGRVELHVTARVPVAGGK